MIWAPTDTNLLQAWGSLRRKWMEFGIFKMDVHTYMHTKHHPGLSWLDQGSENRWGSQAIGQMGTWLCTRARGPKRAKLDQKARGGKGRERRSAEYSRAEQAVSGQWELGSRRFPSNGMTRRWMMKMWLP